MATVPFTVLPLTLTEAIGFVLAVAGIVGTLLVLGVRDWRCWMITLLWVPTFSAIQIANVTSVLLFGVALLWRYRNRAVVSGIILGFLIAIKLYVWPLAIVFVGARRLGSVAIAGVAAVVLIFGTWAPIGFAGLGSYPHLLSLLTRLERGDAYTLSAALVPTLSWSVAEAVTTGVGLVVLALAGWVAHRDDERRAFAYAIGAMFLLTPIVPMNYFVVLMVVIAIYQPTFGPLWAMPLLLWLGPAVTNGKPWQTWAVLVIVTATIVAATRSGRRDLHATAADDRQPLTRLASLTTAEPRRTRSDADGAGLGRPVALGWRPPAQRRPVRSRRKRTGRPRLGSS